MEAFFQGLWIARHTESTTHKHSNGQMMLNTVQTCSI
jgi:hypothetical protein